MRILKLNSEDMVFRAIIMAGGRYSFAYYYTMVYYECS